MTSNGVISEEKFLQNGEVVVENDDMNGNIGEEDMVSSIDSPTKEIRIIRKAKRLHRQNSGEGKIENGPKIPFNNKTAVPTLKNSRKSRDGKGRGLAKKGSILLILSTAVVHSILLYCFLHEYVHIYRNFRIFEV